MSVFPFFYSDLFPYPLLIFYQYISLTVLVFQLVGGWMWLVLEVG